MDPNLIKHTDDIPVPFLFGASDGASLKGIYISWKTLSIDNKVYIYRSDSIDGEFKEIDLTIEQSLALDNTVIPGKIYYYKIKAFYYGLGESSFSNIDSGFRSGSPQDIYEADDLTDDAKEYEVGKEIQTRSMYPENDIDWIKLFLEKDNYYMIEVLSSGNKKNDAVLSMDFFDNGLNNLVKIFEEQEHKINYFFPTETSYYFLKISSKNTGDYKLSVNRKNIPPVLDGDVYITKGNSANYIRINWPQSPNALEYQIYRSETYDGNFEKIKINRNKNSNEEFDMTQNNFCYDRNVIADKLYYYKVLGKNIYGEKYFNKIENGFMKKIEPDSFEIDDSINDAKIINIGKLNVQSHTLFPKNDTDYLKFEGVENKNYSIEVLFEDSEIDRASVVLLKSNGNILEKSYLKGSQNGLFKIRGWYCDQSQSYFIKVNPESDLVSSYKIRVIDYKEDKNINDF
ncbi:MAG TPA: hypothetical protein PK771_10440 [Spirochaetota bacterium]|nr:hypothetical protein [Spirochaetota bacterium]